MDPHGVSYWLETAGDPLTRRPPLKGDVDVDVAILGGGYSGLWAAYYLLAQEPSLEIAILEAEFCGFGASGRNGGWCSSRFPLSPEVVERRYGADVARQTVLAMHDTVDEVGRVCQHEGIDAEFRVNGILSLARGEAQVPAIRAAHETYVRLGFAGQNALLNADAARAQVQVEGVRAALHTPHSAAVHPAKLARGLARVVEAKGAAIYEGARVRRLSPGAPPVLETDQGRVRARRAVVLAGEAYLPRVPGFERDVLPMSSTIVLTAPLTPSQWAAIGWSGGEGLGSQAYTVDYLTRTTDGRILYGSRGAAYSFGSTTPEGGSSIAEVQATMRTRLREWFPALGDIAFTHAWSGYLGVTRDWTPGVVFDKASGIGRLGGYTGRGVSTSNLAGRLLSHMILDKPTPLADLPLAQHRSPLWEPEPFRWLGVRYIQDAFRRMDEARDAGRPPPPDAGLALKLSAP